MNPRQGALGLLVVAVLAAAAGAPDALAWLRGTDGVWQPAELWQAALFGGLAVALGGFVLGPMLARELKAAARPSVREFAEQLCEAWGTAPQNCDPLVLAMVRRNQALVKAEWDALYAPEIADRRAMGRRLDDLATGVGVLAKLPGTMHELTDGVRNLASEVRSLGETVKRVEDQGAEHARAIADTREELAAYAGPDRRRGTRDRRTPAR